MAAYANSEMQRGRGKLGIVPTRHTLVSPRCSQLAAFIVSVAMLGVVHSTAGATTSASTSSQPQTRAAPSPGNPVIGPRLRFSGLAGLGMSFGDVDARNSVHDVMPTPLLLGAEAAWGPIPDFDVGIASVVMIGIGAPAQCPEPTASCGIAAGGFGILRGRYHLRPLSTFDPWFGLGAGIEVVGSNGQTTETNSGLFSSSTTTTVSDFYYGPVLGCLQAGFDYRLRPSVYLGANLALAVAYYTNVKRSVEVEGERVSSSSRGIDGATHTWLLMGVQATFDVAL
jgi:hypothetical protein